MTGWNPRRMTQYDKGRRAEYRARDELLKQGPYHSVLRMAGSHGHADLVAVGERSVKFVQVKSTVKDKPSYRAEIDALREWPVPDNCEKELWIWLKQKRAWVIVPC